MEEIFKAMEDDDESLLMMKISIQLIGGFPLKFSMERLTELDKTIQGTDSNKVDGFLKLLNDRKLLPDPASLEEKKDDNISEEVRKKGNLFFASKPPKYLDALNAYNKSLCFAISKDNQCLALTNRSAVFFKMEMYKECLESIDLSREVGLLESVQEKVELRAKMCKDKLKKMRQEEPFVLKIDVPVNEKMPFVAKCVELRENKEFGRHVITNEDIPAGTIIAIKEPFCKIVLNQDKYMKCTNCFGELTHRLMPCDFCTQAMFCSKECNEKAAKDFHAIECPISGFLYKTFYIDYLLAFRMTIKAFLAFPDTETLAVALEKIDREQKNVFSYDWSKELSLEDLYTPIRTLMAKADEQNSQELCLGACLAFHLLKHSCPIFSQRYLTSSNGDNLLKILMCQHIRTVKLNSMSYGNFSFTEDSHYGYGKAICGFYSLFNHSCEQNVAPFAVGGKQGIIAMKNISKGKQLFTNYRDLYENVDKETRQKDLYNLYGFYCKCEACVKDYPTCDIELVNIPSAIIPRNLRERFSVEFNKRGFTFYNDYLRKNSIFYPNPKFSKAQIMMITCLNFLCVVPLQSREFMINN